MRNEYLRPANELSLPVPDGTKSGEPVLVGAFAGVAATDRGAGGNIAGHASVVLDGRAFELDVDGAIGGVGTRIYITDARVLTTAADSGGASPVPYTLWGHTICKADGSFATKAAGVGPAIVKPIVV